MDQKQLESYMDQLWGKYSSYRRDGVLMTETAFHNAVREVLQQMDVDVASKATPEVHDA